MNVKTRKRNERQLRESLQPYVNAPAYTLREKKKL